ncbi:MAG: hypothetical protein WCD31_14390 [Gillisia sp.]
MEKKLPLALILCFLIFSVKAQDISGAWNIKSGEEGQSFTINLTHVSKNHYKGVHCALQFGTSKKDCQNKPDNYTISLVRTNENFYEGNIKSAVTNAKAGFKLQYVPLDNSLVFKLTTIPMGEFYIPKKALMTRR